MWSGNSSPVKCAESFETEAHQDVFEVCFNHLAVGGTAFVVLIIILGFYWLYQKRKRQQGLPALTSRMETKSK